MDNEIFLNSVYEDRYINSIKEYLSKFSEEKTSITKWYQESSGNRKRAFQKKMHDAFINYCLAPREYKNGDYEVYACVKEVDATQEDVVVCISLVTPMMAYTDSRYYLSANDNYDAWYSEYRPYYYEFIATINRDHHFYSELKDRKKNRWSKATISLDKHNSNLEVNGVLHFEGSKGFSEEIWLIINSDIDDELNDKLNSIYEVKIELNKDSIEFQDYFTNTFSFDKGCKVSVLNVGQANCIYIDDRNTKSSMFFDLGAPSLYLGYSDIVRKNLTRLKQYKPTCIVISHWHSDHFMAVYSLKEYGLLCSWIVPNIDENTPTSINRWIKYFKKNKYKHGTTVYVMEGDGLLLDAAFVQLWRGRITDNINTGSLILRIYNALFAGDSLYEFWPDDLKNQLIEIDTLVVPHHCSSLGSGSSYIENVSVLDLFPGDVDKKAYICSGYNKFKHPDYRHWKELKDRGFKLLTTRFSNKRKFVFNIPSFKSYWRSLIMRKVIP